MFSSHGKSRIILHVDLDYFYAQCEVRRTPSLSNKPVVICQFSGRTEFSGAVSTTNYVSRKFGVVSGMPIVTAKEKLDGEDAVFLPTDREYYEKVSESIMSILKSNADKFEQQSVDEAYLDVSERVAHSFEGGRNLAMKIKNDILDNEKLTCSIGVGPNKSVAKIASKYQKPDGLTVVDDNQVKEFMYKLPVAKMHGIGKKTEDKLRQLGIHTIKDLAIYDVEKLGEGIGKKLASYFHSVAVGEENEDVNEWEGQEQLSAISTLKEDTRLIETILTELDKLSERVYRDIIDEDLAFKSVSIIAVLENITVHTRSRTMETHIQNLDVLKRISRKLFSDFLIDEVDFQVRRIGVKVSNLSNKGGQTSLSEFLGG